MKSRTFLLFAAASVLLNAAAAPAAETPNIVVIFTDDQGYADVGCYGAQGFETPHLDALAKSGTRFTDFYVAQAVCGASRTALLTGCYPNRLGMLGAPGPRSRHGINAGEMLLPELVKQKGYATAMFGKWHLGDHPKFLPTSHGFDQYYGLPYSNDMWPYHPTAKHFPDLPLIEGTEVINPKVSPDDQKQLTTDYTKRAVEFIYKNKEKPFLLYVAHAMPHVPLFVSEKFQGRSAQGIYGDVIMEIDWSVGQIVEALEKNGLREKTLVIYTSDNGPWLSYGDHAGSAYPLREGKGTAWDGGVRVPCIMSWPGQVPAARTTREPAMTIDLVPTVAELIGGELPEHGVDGKSILPLIRGEEGAKSPQEAYYFYWGDQLHAVRSGKWKLHFPHDYRSLKGEPGSGGMPGPYVQKKTDFALYDLTVDMGELVDLKQKHPQIADRLRKLGEAYDKDLKANRRPADRLTDEEFAARWPEAKK